MTTKKKTKPKVDLHKVALKHAHSRLGLTMLLKNAYRQLDESRKRITELMDEVALLKDVIHRANEELASCELDLKTRDGEIEFWMEDSDYYRGRLLDHARERAIRAAEKAEEESGEQSGRRDLTRDERLRIAREAAGAWSGREETDRQSGTNA